MELLRCRDRELSNLQALLRSVTRRLENARDILDHVAQGAFVSDAAREIDAVLEVLS